jgi:RNA polymerase sigma factor (sigma-70 family)
VVAKKVRYDDVDLSDGEILKGIKAGTISEYVIYNRYKAMLFKHGYNIKCVLKENNDFMDDYCQEAYFKVREAIAYTKEHMILGETWSFSVVLWYFIKNLDNSYYRRAKKRGKLGLMEDIDLDFDECVDTRYCVESQFTDEREVDRFFEKLTVRQRKILEHRREGKTMHEIKDILGVSYGLVNLEIKKSKETLFVTMGIRV